VCEKRLAPSHRLGITEKKQNTDLLNTLFKTADTALENIDALIEIIHTAQPFFYGGYQSARKIISTSTGTLAIKGTVSDDQTNTPLKAAKLIFTSNTTSETFTKTTAPKGGFNIKSIDPDTYSLQISKSGYNTKIISITTEQNQLLTLELKLSKS
jgi:Carboxypeptidase regulatory-like domain